MKILDVNSTVSNIFTIPLGGQITLQAIGLENDDYIELELVRTADVGAHAGHVSLPEIGWHVPLTVQDRTGAEIPVRIYPNRPYLIIDAPQMMQLVAVKYADPAAQIEVLLEHTSSVGFSSIDTTLAQR